MNNPEQAKNEINLLAQKLAEQVQLDILDRAEAKGYPAIPASKQRRAMGYSATDQTVSKLSTIVQERLNNRPTHLINFFISMLIMVLASMSFVNNVIASQSANLTTMSVTIIVGIAMIFSYISTYQIFTSAVETKRMKGVTLTLSILLTLIFLSMVVVQILLVTGVIFSFVASKIPV